MSEISCYGEYKDLAEACKLCAVRQECAEALAWRLGTFGEQACNGGRRMNIRIVCRYCGDLVETETDDLLHASNRALYEHAFGDCLKKENPKLNLRREREEEG